MIDITKEELDSIIIVEEAPKPLSYHDHVHIE